MLAFSYINYKVHYYQTMIKTNVFNIYETYSQQIYYQFAEKYIKVPNFQYTGVVIILANIN